MSETPNTITGIKRELLMRLGHDADIFALISLCTREPYVVCDEETFDDEVFLFLDEEEAKKEAARLAEEKVPVTVAKINGKDMLVFFTGLYALGVNALVVTDKGEKASIQVSDIVKRKSPEDMPQGTVWVENPALHLTAAYLAQEMRRPAAAADKERMAELNEELTADFKKGTFIFALQKEEKGIPLVKLKDGQLYQPAFTDILEFQKFNRENKMRPVVVEAAKVPSVLANEAQGIILNVVGVNLPLTVSRPKAPAAQIQRTIPVPGEAAEEKKAEETEN